MALTLLSANNASTVLSAGISASATTLTVNTGTGGLFPSPVSGTSFFKLTLIDAATGTLTEIVHVTARTGDTMTIIRGQEGTVSRLWSANDIAANMMTAGTLDLFAQSVSLGGAASLNVGTAAGTVAAGNDNRITGALQKSANLSDLQSTSTARTNLGLGGAAVLNVGTTVGTVAAGDDPRITASLLKANNLSDLTNVPAALLNLGLGDAAKLGVATNAQMAAGTSTALLPTVAAVMSLFSKRSFGMNDYIRIPDVPGGLILQWGRVVIPTAVNEKSAKITYPIQFPTAVFSITGTSCIPGDNYADGGGDFPGFQHIGGVTGCTVWAFERVLNSTVGGFVAYFVIGY
ncbi:TPA: gp53-like domain-containing protein [Yersinia enterocolitica]